MLTLTLNPNPNRNPDVQSRLAPKRTILADSQPYNSDLNLQA